MALNIPFLQVALDFTHGLDQGTKRSYVLRRHTVSGPALIEVIKQYPQSILEFEILNYSLAQCGDIVFVEKLRYFSAR